MLYGIYNYLPWLEPSAARQPVEAGLVILYQIYTRLLVFCLPFGLMTICQKSYVFCNTAVLLGFDYMEISAIDIYLKENN